MQSETDGLPFWFGSESVRMPLLNNCTSWYLPQNSSKVMETLTNFYQALAIRQALF